MLLVGLLYVIAFRACCALPGVDSGRFADGMILRLFIEIRPEVEKEVPALGWFGCWLSRCIYDQHMNCVDKQLQPDTSVLAETSHAMNRFCSFLGV